MTSQILKELLHEGIPAELPILKPYDENLNHAPKRKDILNIAEKKLAVKNALRYFPEIISSCSGKRICRMNLRITEGSICTGSGLIMK